MAHLAPQQAIFSPSVARAAASAAKDWAYVDAWLRNKYRHLDTRPPSFERNPQVLDALLALIAANESADDERHRLSQLDDAALHQLTSASASTQHPVDELLHTIDAGLTRDGRTALDAMADVAVTLDMAALPESARLAHRFVELQATANELDHALHRLDILQSYVGAHSQDLPREPTYRLDPALAGQNSALNRTIRATDSLLPDLEHHVESLRNAVGTPSMTVEQVRSDEEAYSQLLANKKHLDAQVRAFAGLPPDIAAARIELEALREQLRRATDTRDANFELLVERESPAKPRAPRRS